MIWPQMWRNSAGSAGNGPFLAGSGRFFFLISACVLQSTPSPCFSGLFGGLSLLFATPLGFFAELWPRLLNWEDVW